MTKYEIIFNMALEEYRVKSNMLNFNHVEVWDVVKGYLKWSMTPLPGRSSKQSKSARHPAYTII